MLSTKVARPLCHSCKLDLYNLFLSGTAVPAKAVRTRPIRPQLFQSQSRAYRALSAQRNRETTTAASTLDPTPVQLASPQDNEDAARKARETFGHTLPANFLSSEQYQVYERMYGAPLRESTADDIQQLREDAGESDAPVESEEVSDLTIYKKTRAGKFEAVEEQFDEREEEELDEEFRVNEDDGDAQFVRGETEESIKAREALRLDMLAAERRHYIETGEMGEEEDMETSGPRAHPYTTNGRYGTEPYSITLPNRTFVDPITAILEAGSRKQLLEMARRTFGGVRLQDSVATPVKAKAEHFQQKPVALEAAQPKMGELEASAYVAVNMPGVYASVMSILVECRKRLGSDWLEGLLTREGGPRILDAGAAGAGVLAWQDILRAEWARLHPDVKPGDPVPFGKSTVLTGSTELRSRVRLLLDNTTFIPRLPDFAATRDLPGAPNHDPSLRKQYDIVIAAHSLWTLKEDYMRKAQVQNYYTLLNPNGGVLILLEKGVPRGFELVAGAREVLLKHHISSPGEAERLEPLNNRRTHKEKGMIIAPCTNHGRCPMYPEDGQMAYRKDWCYFAQRFVRPPFLQDLLGKSYRNHEDIQYSYVAVRRGVDTRPAGQITTDETLTKAAFKGYEHSEIEPNSLSLPRLLLPPIKRHKHVTMDVCTPAGTIERWTTTYSFSRQSYRDGRKARWGDLWALGAKVRVVRQARTGNAKVPIRIKSKEAFKNQRDMDEETFESLREEVSPNSSRDRDGNRMTRGSRRRMATEMQ